MENGAEEYKCEKCGSTLLKSNKFLHDLKCINSINTNLFQNQNFININEIGSNYINQNNNYFLCNICNVEINNKDKLDHLLCHQLEKGESEKGDNGNNLFGSDSLNNEMLNVNNNINNINVNIMDINSNDDEDNPHSFVQENEEAEDNEDINSMDDDDFDDDFDYNGIDENVIKTYPVSKIKDINKLTEEKKKCCICLENYKNNDETIILPCVHIFHSNCIKHWMKRQDTCPICKNKII